MTRRESGDAGLSASGWLLPLFAGVVLRGVLMFVSEGHPGDGIHRTIVASDWLQSMGPLFGRTAWPELNYLLPALAIKLGGELFWSPRVLFALLSLAVIPLVFDVTRRMVDLASARVAAWLAALLPYVAVFATDGARSELPTAAGMLLALWGFLRWNYGRGALSDLMMAVVGVVFAEGFRFDGVLIGAVLGALLLLDLFTDADSATRGRRAAALALFGGLCLVYPLALSATWMRLFNDPLYFLHTAQENSRQFLVNGAHPRWPMWLYRSYSVAFVPLGIAFILTPVVGVFGLAGVMRTRRERKALPALLLLLIFALYIFRNLLNFTQQPQIRYVLPLSILLLPFVGPGYHWMVDRVARVLGARRARLAVLWATCAAMVGNEALVAAATMKDLGVISRHLGGSGLVQRNAFSSRSAYRDARRLAATGDSLLVTPFASTTYSFLSRDFRRDRLPTRHLVIYRTDVLVYASPEFADMVDRTVPRFRFVLADVGGLVQGFQDGFHDDPIGRAVGARTQGTATWRSHRFRIVGRYGDTVLLERITDGS